MKRWMLAISLCCFSCAANTPIEGQLSRDVEKDPFDWDDPGAIPDPALDAGRPELDAASDMDSAVEEEPVEGDAG
jgi:hypothetical protein